MADSGPKATVPYTSKTAYVAREPKRAPSRAVGGIILVVRFSDAVPCIDVEEQTWAHVGRDVDDNEDELPCTCVFSEREKQGTIDHLICNCGNRTTLHSARSPPPSLPLCNECDAEHHSLATSTTCKLQDRHSPFDRYLATYRIIIPLSSCKRHHLQHLSNSRPPSDSGRKAKRSAVLVF